MVSLALEFLQIRDWSIVAHRDYPRNATYGAQYPPFHLECPKGRQAKTSLGLSLSTYHRFPPCHTNIPFFPIECSCGIQQDYIPRPIKRHRGSSFLWLNSCNSRTHKEPSRPCHIGIRLLLSPSHTKR